MNRTNKTHRGESPSSTTPQSLPGQSSSLSEAPSEDALTFSDPRSESPPAQNEDTQPRVSEPTSVIHHVPDERRETQETDIPVDSSPQTTKGTSSEGRSGDHSLIINPFHPSRMRMGTNYGDLAGGQDGELKVKVWAKPPKAAWFRAHPENEVDVLMLDLTDSDQDALYYLDRSLWPELTDEPLVGMRLLVQCQTRQKTNFLWAIKLKSPFDKRENSWTTSALEERTLARSQWIRHRSNRELQAYSPKISTVITAEPEWPAMRFEEILERGLKDRYIKTLDHEVLVELLKGK
jgi:hypothetical protein